MASKLGGAWWIVAVIVVAAIVGIVVLSKPSAPFIPELNEFERVRAIPYDLETMNCTHKAIIYSDYLRERGWKCWIVIGKVYRARTYHAWVVVIDKKKVRRLCDPTGPVGGVSGFAERSYDRYRPKTYTDEGVIIE